MATAAPGTSAFIALILDANGTFTPTREAAAPGAEPSHCASRLTSEDQRRRALLGPLAGVVSISTVRIPLPRPMDTIPDAVLPLMRAVSSRLADKDATPAAVGRALLDLYHALGTGTRLH